MKKILFTFVGTLFFASCEKGPEPPHPPEPTLEEKVAEFLPGTWRATLKYYCRTVDGPQHIKDEREKEISDEFIDTQAPLWSFWLNRTGSFLGEKNDVNFEWLWSGDKVQISYPTLPVYLASRGGDDWFVESWEVEEISAEKLALVRFEEVDMEHLGYSWTDNSTYRYTFERVE